MFNLRSLGKVGFIAGFATLALAAGCLAGPQDGSISMDNVETIKIGVIGPMTGSNAELGAIGQKSAKLAAKQINASGGIMGKNIEILVEDGQCEGKIAATAAQKLINTNKVHVIMGGICNEETLGATPFAEQGKTPLIAWGASIGKISQAGDFVFRTYPSDTGKGQLLAEIAINQGFKKIGVIAEQTDYALGLKDAFEASLKAKGGETVTEIYTSDSSDVRAQLSRLKEAKVEALLVNPQSTEKGALIFQQLGEMKWKVPLLTQNIVMNDKTTLEKEKNLLEDMMGADVTVKDNDPAVLKFRNDYKAEYGADVHFEIFAQAIYDGVMISKWAIEKAGTVDGTKIKETLYMLKDYKGLLGTYSFDSNGDSTVMSVPLKVKDGKAVAAPELIEKKAATEETAAKTEAPTEAKVEEKTQAPADTATADEVKVEVKADGQVEVKASE